MKLISYKALCGDAFHIRYVGDSGINRHIFLDMGASRTYSSILQHVISKISEQKEHIDAIFLSHIHDDHIGGAIRYIKDIQAKKQLMTITTNWFYNAPKKYEIENVVPPQEGVQCGIVSGDFLYEFLSLENKYPTQDIIVGCKMEFDGLIVKILSPDKEHLENLRKKYIIKRPLCKLETDDISVEAGNVHDDYSVKLKDFTINNFQEDQSIENASSIAALIEKDGKKILWLADSVPSVIVKSLANLGYNKDQKLYCDLVILAHHGSACNNNVDLFNIVSSPKYLISSDGINRYCLPNKETLARLISTLSSMPTTIYFNYNNGRIPRIFKDDDIHTLKPNLNVHYLNDCEEIKL